MAAIDKMMVGGGLAAEKAAVDRAVEEKGDLMIGDMATGGSRTDDMAANHGRVSNDDLVVTDPEGSALSATVSENQDLIEEDLTPPERGYMIGSFLIDSVLQMIDIVISATGSSKIVVEDQQMSERPRLDRVMRKGRVIAVVVVLNAAAVATVSGKNTLTVTSKTKLKKAQDF